MIKELDETTKKRVNRAIENIRLIASRVKRMHIEDAQQKREIVVSLLNEFRQYVNAYGIDPETAGRDTTFKHDQGTMERVVQATFQADDIYHKLTRERQKTYAQEYNQVWKLLEDVHTWLQTIIKKEDNNA